MGCSGCNKPRKQVRLNSSSTVNMAGHEVKNLLNCLRLNTLMEICKEPNSANSYMHFSTEEGASAFYNTHVEDGFTIENVRFTVHAAEMSNGSLVSYRHRELRFAPAATPSAPKATTTTTIASISPVNATTTTTIASISPVNASSTAANVSSTASNVSSTASNASSTTTNASSTSEWRSSTKRAIDQINEEIERLKKRRGYLRRALNE